MGIVIDAFAHAMPQRFAEALFEVHPTDELRKLAKHSYFGDMSNRVRVLDKFGIDKQVLTLARPSILIGTPPEAMPEMTRVANDTVAALAEEFPDRLLATGTLPVPTEEYLPEFDRCVNELGVAGIQVFTNVGGQRLHEPRFRAFWAKANATKTPVWIHPQLIAGWPEEFALDKIFGWLYETTITLAQLVFSGIMEEYPDLRIIPHHMGAMIPYNEGRLRGFYTARDLYPGTGFTTLPKDPIHYFKKFYADTMLCGSVPPFEAGYKFYGADRLVMATDYPFGPEQGELWMKQTMEQIDALGLGQVEKDKILGGNMVRLIARQ